MGSLHEESINECLTDVDVELFSVGLRDRVNLELFHVALELGPEVVDLGEGVFIEMVVPCPIFVPAVYTSPKVVEHPVTRRKLGLNRWGSSSKASSTLV